MEHFIRIAFWIVTLAGCLSARSILTRGITSSLKTEVKCPSDLTLYTPENVVTQCMTKALGCFKKELEGPVKEECSDRDRYIEQPLYELNEEINERLQRAQNNSAECALECENWPELPFHDFLGKLDSLIQQVNYEASG